MAKCRDTLLADTQLRQSVQFMAVLARATDVVDLDAIGLIRLERADGTTLDTTFGSGGKGAEKGTSLFS